jgi:hypothetical protein
LRKLDLTEFRIRRILRSYTFTQSLIWERRHLAGDCLPEKFAGETLGLCSWQAPALLESAAIKAPFWVRVEPG